jgi:hypothetical protein
VPGLWPLPSLKPSSFCTLVLLSEIPGLPAAASRIAMVAAACGLLQVQENNPPINLPVARFVPFSWQGHVIVDVYYPRVSLPKWIDFWAWRTKSGDMYY